ARLWDRTVAQVRVHQVRAGVKAGGSGPWAWALGPPQDDHGLREERRLAAAQIVELTVATASEQFRAAAMELPPWARAHLAANAAIGRCVHDPGELLDLYARIAAYRESALVVVPDEPSSTEEGILGSPPDDAIGRAIRIGLVRRALPGADRRPTRTRTVS
ncbi:MAG: hypothetical protein ACR2KK_14920, partial [Acidimicrobiales bacterium]